MACASCRSYENAREHSLRVIRETLLAKLGFTQAPNTTGRELPQVPAALMERFERRKPPQGVQADSPAPTRTFVTHIEQDDFLARTDNVLIFGQWLKIAEDSDIYCRRRDKFLGETDRVDRKRGNLLTALTEDEYKVFKDFVQINKSKK